MTNFRQTVWVGALLCVLGSGADTAYGQWSQFRGPNGSGVDSAVGYPVAFSPSKNVLWKKAVPFGQSSPALAAKHLYLTASEGDKLVTISGPFCEARVRRFELRSRIPVSSQSVWSLLR
ncbi:MAG: hypothetical protein LC804_25030 [Acidobacteria bacterium]|nr:hypothetical protein [Acidobacteriota bacterium]